MKKTSSFVSLALGLILAATSSMAMSTTPMTTGDALAQSLLGPGISISNVSYIGSTLSSGYFTGGTAAGIDIESGIVLTSGYVTNLNGTTNTSDSITGSLSAPGDAQLDNLIPGYLTYDATILEFDFVSEGDSAYFNYVFGSDEYNEYVESSYNDVFGFFIDGINYALIPGTSTAVSINNVNKSTNSSYYNNNDLTDGIFFPFEYDGFTDVLTTSLLGLIPGDTYHLKLAIADAGDTILDSGVFFQAGSFSDIPVDPTITAVPEPSTFILLGVGFAGLAWRARRRKKM
jgi:hypothetical protein